MLFPLDTDDSNWEVMSSVSSRSDKGYSRVMKRLLKQSKQLNMVVEGDMGKHLSTQICFCFGFNAFLIYQLLMIQYTQSFLSVVSHHPHESE